MLLLNQLRVSWRAVEQINPSGRETQVLQVEQMLCMCLLWGWRQQCGNARNSPAGHLAFVWMVAVGPPACLLCTNPAASFQSKSWKNGVRLKQATNWDVKFGKALCFLLYRDEFCLAFSPSDPLSFCFLPVIRHNLCRVQAVSFWCWLCYSGAIWGSGSSMAQKDSLCPRRLASKSCKMQEEEEKGLGKNLSVPSSSLSSWPA